jgi:hypothetical protein
VDVVENKEETLLNPKTLSQKSLPLRVELKTSNLKKSRAVAVAAGKLHERFLDHHRHTHTHITISAECESRHERIIEDVT